jgi:cytoskeletal protein RodZ
VADSSPALHGSSPVLDTRACRELGVLLAATREARGLTVEQVCGALLLSSRQVLGLERVDAGSFYNTRFYLIALRKYVTYLGVSSDLLDHVVRADEDEKPGPSPAPGLVSRVRDVLFGH